MAGRTCLEKGCGGKAADDKTFPVWPLQRNIFRASMSAELRGEATQSALSLNTHTPMHTSKHTHADTSTGSTYCQSICKQIIWRNISNSCTEQPSAPPIVAGWGWTGLVGWPGPGRTNCWINISPFRNRPFPSDSTKWLNKLTISRKTTDKERIQIIAHAEPLCCVRHYSQSPNLWQILKRGTMGAVAVTHLFVSCRQKWTNSCSVCAVTEA